MRHAFLDALEASGSAVRARGWAPVHALLREDVAGGRLLACSPLYLKGHSAGEYVFDHGWAEAFPQVCPGRSYYPKLQSCVPFTPVTGPRLLAAGAPAGEERAQLASALGRGLVEVGDHLGTSSVHLTFGTAEEWDVLRAQGWLGRRGIQYHWENRGYADFEAFLMDLKQSKRKTMRQERKRVARAGVDLQRLTGADLTPAVWDRFYEFYLDTIDRKWGRAYLTREFFHRLGEVMGDQVLLVVAREGEGGEIIAGALNLMDDEAVYGRNWGCARGKDLKGLHFEVCYYQAIEHAIEAGLQRVEAGAQGEHKISRGYLPVETFSAHHIPDRNFRLAVQAFLQQEGGDIDYTLEAMRAQMDPFKKPSPG